MPKEETKEQETEEKKSDDETKDAEVTMDKVRDVVAEALEPFKKLLSDDDDSGKSDDDDKDEDKKDGEKGAVRTRRSFSAIEHDAEKMVQDAVAKFIGEQEHKKEHEELAKKKAEPEKSPIKVRRLTKFMLGKDYGKDD